MNTDTFNEQEDIQLTAKFAIPDASFPQLKESHSCVPGAQQKFLATKWNGRFYTGVTPPEQHRRYQYALGLVAWFAKKCVRNETGKYAQLGDGDEKKRRQEILIQYYERALLTRAQDFNSLAPREIQWVMRKCLERLDWPLPAALEVDADEYARYLQLKF